MNVAIADAIAVATNTALAFIPEALRMLGFTARMYAMVRNVVRPAITSCLTVVLCSLSLKHFSNITFFLSFDVV